MSWCQLGISQIQAAVARGVQGPHEKTQQSGFTTATGSCQDNKPLPFNGICDTGQDLFVSLGHEKVFCGDSPVKRDLLETVKVSEGLTGLLKYPCSG